MKPCRSRVFLFRPLLEFIATPEKRVIILRHDVDTLPANSLRFARIQSEMGINGTYYFRIVPQSFNEKIIKEIHSMGHEVGYHYEDVSLAAVRLSPSVAPSHHHNVAPASSKSSQIPTHLPII